MPAPPPTTAPSPLQPSPSLLGNFRQALRAYPPFMQMSDADIDAFVSQSTQRYFAPGELVIGPAQGIVQEVYFVRRGGVTGTRPGDVESTPYEYEEGDLFPVSAALAARAVTATYKATADTFVLALGVGAMRDLAERSPVFADFLHGRVQKFLELSRRAVQNAYAAQALDEQSLEAPLSSLIKHTPLACTPDTPLRSALEGMHQRRVGSILVTGAAQEPLGILTRYDILGRVTLAGADLAAPISQVMVAPVLSLDESQSAQDAALLMSQHGIRHVPVTRQGAVVGVVSERDLFALQRLSLKQVGTAIRAAQSIDALKHCAADIRRMARTLLSQGVQARRLTALISHLNDLLTQRLLQCVAGTYGFDLQSICWVALGSEGRSEQTIATDQDNALIVGDDASAGDLAHARSFAAKVNDALDACGFPLCKGGIMAREAACAGTRGQWQERFNQWIEHGAPQDLLDASIFFDLRALGGQTALATGLMDAVASAAQASPRFQKQLALNALQRRAPLNWRGAIDEDAQGGLDLKLQGTAIFVDASRILALAHGLSVTGTRERFEKAGERLGRPAAAIESWAGSFEFLQMLRLRVQLERGASAGADPEAKDGAPEANPNWMPMQALGRIDRRILREALKVASDLQQRLRLDYDR